MQRSFVFLIYIIVALLAGAAFGQVDAGVAAEAQVDVFDRIVSLIADWLPRLVMLASVLTAIFPSGNKIMRIIDALAGAWGKARNDPNAQKWGKAINDPAAQ